jgi:hypothetical protein
MENKYQKSVVTLFMAFFFVAHSAAQIKPKDLPLPYEFEKNTIYSLGKGEILHVTFDSVYIFNKIRYNDMMRLFEYRDFLKAKDPTIKAFFTVLDNQNKALDSLEKYANDLKMNAEKTAQTGEKLALSTIETVKSADIKLDSANKKLIIAQNKLDSANTYLDDAVKLIKKDIRWKWLKNAALVAIGVLLGYLAAK